MTENNYQKWNYLVSNIEEDLIPGVAYDCEGAGGSLDSNRAVCQKNELYPSCSIEPSVSIFQGIWDTEIKAQRRLQEKQAELNLLADFNEAERERRKAEVEDITMDEDGKLLVRTENTRLAYKDRRLANFCKPRLIRVINATTKEQGFILSINIDDRRRTFPILSKDISNAEIILKKLNSVGADFLTDKRTRKKKYAAMLMVLLLRQEVKSLCIANEKGWFFDLSHKIKFCEEENHTWRSVFC